MAERRDPIESASDGTRDLYDIATWEERTSLDGLSVALYWLLTRTAKALVLLTAFVILISIFATIGLSTVLNPALGILTVLSVVPAFGLAAYVYYSDVTTKEPLSLLVATFLLSILTATFAAIVNTELRGVFEPLGSIGLILFFFLVVGPGEEAVKLLAVRLYAYNDSRFDSVLDGAVYGAIAGLGFAFIENALYIIQNLQQSGMLTDLSLGVSAFTAGGEITAIRAFAGPGHVVYSAFAGYYLGLAKFNRENRGPIIVKGLLIAAVIHATYNSTVGLGTGIIATYTGLPGLSAFVVYATLFISVFGAILFQKIWRYQRTFHEVHAEIDHDAEPELTEFDR
ncbi:PrsW family intramembrane metalloprotease [Halorubraceae archaeon YAN]|nr:PrsW family intramembrane metalloprotease [Halorubraceae archaeon YAN]